MGSNKNRVLASLAANDFGLLEPDLSSVSLGIRKRLEKLKTRIEVVYFPESGFCVQTSHTDLQRGIQNGHTIGALALDGTRPNRWRHLAVYSRQEHGDLAAPRVKLRPCLRCLTRNFERDPLTSEVPPCADVRLLRNVRRSRARKRFMECNARHKQKDRLAAVSS